MRGLNPTSGNQCSQKTDERDVFILPVAIVCLEMQGFQAVP